MKKPQIKFNGRKIVKGITRTSVGVCVSATVYKVIDAVLPVEELDQEEQVMVAVGSAGAGLAAANIVGGATDELVDGCFDLFDKKPKVTVVDGHTIIDGEVVEEDD